MFFNLFYSFKVLIFRVKFVSLKGPGITHNDKISTYSNNMDILAPTKADPTHEPTANSHGCLSGIKDSVGLVLRKEYQIHCFGKN